VAAGLIAVLLLAGLLVWRVAAQRVARKARDRFHATVERLHLDLERRHAAPRSENAATWLRAAASLADEECLTKTVEALAVRPPSSWSGQERRAASSCLQANTEVLDLLHRASRCSASNWELDLTLTARKPPLIQLLHCSRLLAISASLHFDRGERDEAMEDLAALATVARSLEPEKQLICPLVGVVSENLLLTALGRQVGAGRIGPAQAETVEAMLPTTDLVRVAQQALGAGTRAFVTSVSRWRNRTWETAAASDSVFSVLLVRLGSSLGIPWRDAVVTASYDAGVLRIETVATPYPKLLAAAPPSFRAPFPANHVLSKSAFALHLLPSLAGRMQETMAWRHLAHAGLELLRTGAREGRYPGTLPAAFRTVEPFCNCSPRLELHPDGSARLELPGARKLVNELWSWTTEKSYHRLEWQLPAPHASR